MPDHFKNIYQNHADAYDQMVRVEDYEGNILKTLQAIGLSPESVVVEFGAGTGRVTRLLLPHVRRVHAFDFMPSMLTVARQTFVPADNWSVAVADNGHMPVAPNSADMTIEGWSFAHVRGWFPDTWQMVFDRYIAEMQRILKPGGTAVLIETMGTGSETPAPPNEGLAELFAYMENQHGFTYRWARTDYKFDSLDEAIKLTGMFFGEDFAKRVREENWVIVPECTGFWSKTF